MTRRLHRERRGTIDIHPVVRHKAEHLGVRGTEWLAHLPELVSDLERQWSITVGDAFSGGTTAYVCRARTHDGDAVVLKVSLPEDGFGNSVRLLEAAQGHGYVRLLAHDTERYAVLQEALSGPAEDMRSFGRSFLEALGLGGKSVLHGALGLRHRGEAAGGQVMLLGVVPDRFDSRELRAVGG